ncbi:MAG: molecular chaperone [Desulfopila sp.]
MTTMENLIVHGDCFKLLAAAFYEPEKDFFLEEKLCENLASLLATNGCLDASAAAEKMTAALAESDQSTLLVEYARLFVGPFELVAPPYGSVYLEKERRLMGDSTLAVQKMYHDAGLDLEIKDVPDHIAFELEFMHYLCQCEVEAANDHTAVQELRRKQATFYAHFLAPWIPDFCASIRNGTESKFYSALAECLHAFITGTASRFELSGLFQPGDKTCAC